MNKNIYAIILAAGKGRRMGCGKAKCASLLNDKSFVEHIVDTLKELRIKNIIVVVGYKKEEIMNILKDTVVYAFQNEQLGTADAVRCCVGIVPKDSLSLIIPGDMPLISNDIINNLIEKHYEEKNDLTFLSTILNKELYYGRVIKDNEKYRIVEYKDLKDDEKKIKEVNAGVYLANSKILFNELLNIKNNNNQNEYYLTDIVEKISSYGKVSRLLVENDISVIGINDKETLNEILNKI